MDQGDDLHAGNKPLNNGPSDMLPGTLKGGDDIASSDIYKDQHTGALTNNMLNLEA